MLYAFLAVIIGVILYGVGQFYGGDTGGYIGLALGVVSGVCINWLSQGKSIREETVKKFNDFVASSKALLIAGLTLIGILVVIGLVVGLFSWVASLSASTIIIVLLILILLK